MAISYDYPSFTVENDHLYSSKRNVFNCLNLPYHQQLRNLIVENVDVVVEIITHTEIIDASEVNNGLFLRNYHRIQLSLPPMIIIQYQRVFSVEILRENQRSKM